MTQQPASDTPMPSPPPRGIFLPSMIWTTDRKTVEAERGRLLALHEQLTAVANKANPADACATWLMMAEEALHQLDRDIDALFDWLETTERSQR